MRRLFLGAVIACFLMGAISGIVVPPPDFNQLAAVPYTGFNSFYAQGLTPTQTYMQAVSDFLVSSGLQAAWGGPVIAGVDEGWAAQTGNTVTRSGGNPVASANFTSIATMVSHIKANGQHPAIYRDGGQIGCQSEDWGAGTINSDLSFFFQTQGFDVIKIDGCGLFSGATAIASGRSVFTAAKTTLDGFGIPYIDMFGYSAGTFNGYTQTFAYGNRAGTAWRLSKDVGTTTCSGTSFDFLGGLSGQVMNNVWAAVHHPGVIGPYHFADIDYLMANNNGTGGSLNTNEAVSQMILAAVLSSPWVLGCDPRNLGATELATLKNADLIGILKDSWVYGGRRVFGQTPNGYGNAGTFEIYCKRLSTGNLAIAAVNEQTAATGAQTIAVDPSKCGVNTANTYTFKDVLSGATTTGQTSTFNTSSLASHATGIFLISAFTASNATCWATNPGGTGQTDSGLTGGCAATSDNNGNPAGGFPADGTTVSTATAINTTADPAPSPQQGCYQKQRKGVIASDDFNEAGIEYLADNLQAGRSYKYYIDFAEIEGNTTGQRLFNLTLNTGAQSVALLSGYDIFANAGGANKAVVVQGTITADHGYISFDFEPLATPVGVPTVGCIEVVAQ